MQKIRIIVTEDHLLVREIWVKFLNSVDDFEVVAEARSAEECLELANIHTPDIILLDINLPGMNGLDAAREIRNQNPQTRVIGVSAHTHPSFAKKMMSQGASGYLTKNATGEELIAAIRMVSQGQRYISTEIKEKLTNQLLYDVNDSREKINSLTRREMEIIEHVRQGKSSGTIAEILKISKKTIEVHRYNILKKLDIGNSAALINFMNENYSRLGI